MPDPIATALARMDRRQIRHHASDHLARIIARQRRELAAETQIPKD